MNKEVIYDVCWEGPFKWDEKDDKMKDIKESGKWLGILERILIFLAVWVQAHTIIVGWLVFKVGTKWEVWSNIVKVPDSISES